MDDKQRNTLLAVGVASGLLSLPMPWLVFRIPGAFGGGPLVDVADDLYANVTGLNGTALLLISVPIWFVMVFAILANLLQFKCFSEMIVIPRAVLWAFAIFSEAWIAIPVFLSMSGGTPGMGWTLGNVCAIAAITSLRFSDDVAKKRKNGVSSKDFLPDDLPGLSKEREDA